MKRRGFTGVVALGVFLAATWASSQSKPLVEGPAAGETPAWFLQGSFPDPTGRTIVEPGGKVTVPAREGGAGRGGGRGAGAAARGAAPPAGAVPGCSRSPLCGVAAALRASRCSASSGSRRSGTRSRIRITAARLWRRSFRRARFERQSLGLSACRRGKTAGLQVRSQLQADPRRSATT